MTLIYFVLHIFNILASSKNCWHHKSRPLIADLSLSFKFFQGKKIPYSRGEIVSLFQVLDFGDDAQRLWARPDLSRENGEGLGHAPHSTTVWTPWTGYQNSWKCLPCLKSQNSHTASAAWLAQLGKRRSAERRFLGYDWGESAAFALITSANG